MNFIEKKENEFQNSLNGLQTKCKQNGLLYVIGILGDDQLKGLKEETISSDVFNYIENLKTRLWNDYENMEVKDDK